MAQHSLYKVFLIASSILFISFLQSPAFCETQTEDNNTYGKLLTIGAFTSRDEPKDFDSILVNYEETFDTCERFYVGILLQNNGTKTVDVKVKYKLLGKKRKGKETLTSTVKKGLNALYVCDGLCRPGRYSYKMTMFTPDHRKISKSAKIKVKINNNGGLCDDNQTPTPTITPTATATPSPTPTPPNPSVDISHD